MVHSCSKALQGHCIQPEALPAKVLQGCRISAVYRRACWEHASVRGTLRERACGWRPRTSGACGVGCLARASACCGRSHAIKRVAWGL